MNSNEYIASGMLENYVLGTTTPSETMEVERLAKENPTLQSEINKIQHTLEEYAFTHAVNPPLYLKEKIHQQLRFNDNIKPFTPNVPPIRTFNIAASWVLLALSIAANVWFWGSWQSSENKVLALESQNLQLAQGEEVLKANYQQEVAVLQNPNTKRINLAGQASSPNAKAMIYWNTATCDVYLSSLKLPVAPTEKQYQLWAIVDGKPVDAGIIAATTHLLKMKSFGKAVAFAISLEAKGGSTTEAGPKGTIYVMGAV